MKISTYNINGLSARLPVLLRWLEETQPDVACLQELKSPQERFPEQELKNAGYHVYISQMVTLRRDQNSIINLPGSIDYTNMLLSY